MHLYRRAPVAGRLMQEFVQGEAWPLISLRCRIPASSVRRVLHGGRRMR